MIFPRRAKLVDFAVCPMFSLFAVARFVCEKVANKLRKNGKRLPDLERKTHLVTVTKVSCEPLF